MVYVKRKNVKWVILQIKQIVKCGKLIVLLMNLKISVQIGPILVMN